jgi:DNA-binding SARP family transcriptional activator
MTRPCEPIFGFRTAASPLGAQAASDRPAAASAIVHTLHAPPLCIGTRPDPIRIHTLGRFEVVVNGEILGYTRKAPRRVLDLLKALVALGADGVSCNVVATAMWPDSEGDTAYTAFEVTLHRLRKLLGRGDALQVARGMLRLNPAVAWVDALAFEQAVVRACGNRDAIDPEAAQDALALYAGSFLHNEEDASWLLPARERLRSRYIRLASRLAQYFEGSAQPARATAIYAAALEAEPLAEELYRGLMACLAAQGRRAEAFNAYRRCRQMLSVVLGVAPSRETEALQYGIARVA